MIQQRDKDGKIKPGSGGRTPGARNKLQAEFVQAMQDDFKQHGADVVKIVRMEKPTEYLKIIASILPKELVMSDDVLSGLSDEEIAQAMAVIRRIRAETPAASENSDVTPRRGH